MDWGYILSSALRELISPTTAAYALAAIGIGVHFGYSGLLNFGQAGFMAVGAYAYVITVTTFGQTFFAGILASVIASVLFAFLLGVPTLRLRSDYLAIVTIAAAEIVRYFVTTTGATDITGGAAGRTGYGASFDAVNPYLLFGMPAQQATVAWNYTFPWALVALATGLVFLIMRSPWGRVVKGIREDEDAVRSLGKNVFAFKMQALIIGGVMGSLAGVVYVFGRSSLQPGAFGTALTFFVWTILLLGGAATIFGPIVGSMIFWVLLSFINNVLIESPLGADGSPFENSIGQVRFIIVGIALMLIVVFRPQGIFGNKKELSFNV